MQFARHAFANPPRSFGRGPVRVLVAEEPAPAPAFRFTDDFKLFATTFAAGFLFVTLFIG